MIERGLSRVFPGSAGAAAPVIYVVDMPEHPFDIAAVAVGRRATIVTVPVSSWGANLTPWEAPGLHPDDPPFAGHAPALLDELRHDFIPGVEREHGLTPSARAICGYSLGGLFALYAFLSWGELRAMASLSGSLWYPGLVAWVRDTLSDGEGRFCFFSVGKREAKAGPRIMRSVQDDMETCARICRERGCAVEVEVGPGNHMQHHTERLDAGITAIDAHLAERR